MILHLTLFWFWYVHPIITKLKHQHKTALYSIFMTEKGVLNNYLYGNRDLMDFKKLRLMLVCTSENFLITR